MNPDNIARLVEELRRDEGVRYTPYADTKGIPTVGVGHNLQACPLPDGWSYPLSDDQVNTLLERDLANVFSDLNRDLPWWVDLNDVRQRVICNMQFNLGSTRLLEFTKALTAMRQGRYQDAAAEMLKSAWAGQVKARATRLAQMMREGV
jgi:lysozyme